jgi:hypothetical protein
LGAEQSPDLERKAQRMTNLVTWLAAPDWLTPSEAAALLGPAEDVASILALMHAGAVDWEEIDGADRIAAAARVSTGAGEMRSYEG